jgi:DNA-binding winged helix-turn-helix (wHTH) protein
MKVKPEEIDEVLREAQKPLSRDEILNEVMKRRVVKKNTVLVGLSNKQLFKKVGKNQYALA